MPTYRLDILVTGTDRASPKLSRIGRALGRIWQIASGILVAGVIRAVTGQIFDLGRTAIESYSNLERMEVSLQSLIAREMARGEAVEETSTFIRQLSEAEVLALDKLILKYADLESEMALLQDEQVGVLNDFGEGSLEALTYSVAIRELGIEMAGVSDEIDNLQGLQGKLITVTESSLVKTLSLADALGMAAEPAKELTNWVVALSLRSPFSETDILQALRVAAGYGFITQYASELATEEERLRQARADDVVTAQRLTAGLLDLMAAIGLPSENLGRIVLALGQVRAHGRLLAQEIRQMVNAGVGLDVMAMAMGMTVEEFMNAQKEGNILAEDFLPALVTLLEEDLAGAAERIMNTFGGAIISLQKFKEVGLRTFFGPLFEALTPGLREFADSMISEENLAKIEQWGIVFRDWVFEVYHQLQRVAGHIQHIKELLDKYSPFELVVKITGDLLDMDLLTPLEEARTRIGEINTDLGLIQDPQGAKQGALLAGLTVLLGPTVISFVKTWGPKLIGIVAGIGSKFTWLGIIAGIAGFLVGGNFLGIRDTIVDAWEKKIRPALEDFQEWLSINVPLAMQELESVWNQDVLPELERGWLWVEDNIIPILEDWYKWLAERVNLALKKTVEWVRDDLIPKLGELYILLRDDLIPELTTLAVDTFIEVGREAKTAGRNIAEYLNPKIEAIKDAWEESKPSLIELGNWLGEESKEHLTQFATWWKKLFGAPIMSAIAVIDAWMGPEGSLRKFFRGFKDFGLKILPDLGWAWDEYVVPILEYIASWWVEHVNPVIAEFYRLFKNIRRIFLQISGAAWQKLNEVLGFLLVRFEEDINPAVGDFWEFIEDIYEAFAGWFSDKIKWVYENILPELAKAAEWVGRAFDAVATAISNVNDALENLTLPDWATGDSPPPLAYWLWDIEKAAKDADDAFRQSMFTKGGFADMDIGRIPMNGRAGQPAPVVLEGDTNTFIVPNRDVARFVVHQLKETKKKQFAEYMGRT